MKTRPSPAATIGILSLLGLLSALLSIVVPALLTAPRSPLFVGSSLGIFAGDIFGALIAVYFLTYAGIRSVTKAIGLVVASSFAYFVAMFSGTILGMFASAAMGLHSNWDTDSAELRADMVAPLLIAGVLGAFLVLAAALRLYSAEPSWRRVMRKSLPWSLVGGLLALVGWGLGPSLGMSVWSTLKSHQLVPPNEDMQYAARSMNLNQYSVDIVWQIGMAIILGVLLSETQFVPAALSTHTVPERKQKPSNAFLLALMAIPLAWFVLPSLPNDYQEMLWHRAHREELAAGPISHLPKIDTTPADTMLILAPIGKYLPEPARAVHSTIDQFYSVRYSLTGGPHAGPSSIGPHADVVVQDWPSGWAKSELENQGQGFSKIAHKNAYGASVEERTKFGNRVLFKRNPEAYYAWMSNDRIVLMQFYSVDPDEFLKEYLEKYPSTL
jgi:hypothetical protein